MNKNFLCSLWLIGLAILGTLIGSSCKSQEEKLVPPPIEGKASIIIVYDNYQVDSSLTTDWGFGCVIRTPTKNILFDTGANSSILLSNMGKMQIDPEDIDIVVISHIHGDHVGGLDGFLERNGDVKVYIPSSFPNSIREKIKSYGAEYEDVKGSMQISENVYTTGEMGTSIKEQSLVLNTKEGLTVITGCAHPGVVNIVKKAKQMLPDKTIYLVMGGFHLFGASDSELKSIIMEFRDLGVQKVAPSHCSGDRCRELFKEEYKEDYIESGVGKIIILYTVGIKERAALPTASKVFVLSEIYPNPFTSEAIIHYQLPIESDVLLEIYSFTGQLMRILVNKKQEAGYYKIAWNGRDNSSKKVTNGIYFYKIQVGNYAETKKMILMR